MKSHEKVLPTAVSKHRHQFSGKLEFHVDIIDPTRQLVELILQPLKRLSLHGDFSCNSAMKWVFIPCAGFQRTVTLSSWHPCERKDPCGIASCLCASFPRAKARGYCPGRSKPSPPAPLPRGEVSQNVCFLEPTACAVGLCSHHFESRSLRCMISDTSKRDYRRYERRQHKLYAQQMKASLAHSASCGL